MTPTHIRTRRIVALAALSCAILLAACGSTGKLHTAAADDHAANQKFATCMRSHGVPNFPDLGTTASYHYMAQVNQSAPAFESAEKVCAKYGNPMAPPAPPSESQMLELVKLAHCMRTHGVPNFPDPTGNNAETYQLIFRLGIDPKSPAFGHAAAVCGNPGMFGSASPTRA